MFQITSIGDQENSAFLSFWKNFFDRKFLAISLLLFSILLLFWYFNPLVLTVTGKAEVSATPEKARVSYLITDVGSNASDALSKVTVKQNKLKSWLLGNFGIKEENIIEGQASVIPPSLAQGLNQYAASMAVELKIDDYLKVSSLVSSLYSEGASYVSQPVLLVENVKAIEDNSYNLALKDADKKAAMIGSKHFKFLRRRVSISVIVSNPEGVGLSRQVLEKGQSEQSPLVSDSLKIVSMVTVTYKMW